MMEKNHIKELLHKYRSNIISTDELKALQQFIETYSDSTLYEIFYEEWNELRDFPPLSEKKINELYTSISKKAKPSFYIILSRHWVKIAAAILIVVISGLSFKLHNKSLLISQLLEQNITIQSGENESSNVLLPDGTKVQLNTRSALSYKADFGQRERKVNLSGEGFFEVKQDKTKKFIVNTEYIDIIVLGTKFNVYAYDNKDFVEMSLIEGRVCVSTIDNQIIVKPNEKIIYDKQTKTLTLKHTTNRIETSWLNKELVFNHETLRNVIDTLERKFGVKIHYPTSINLDDFYTATFDDRNITDIMNILMIHYGFTYVIEGTDIYIELNK